MNQLFANGLSIIAANVYGLLMLNYSMKIVTLKVKPIISIIYTIIVSIVFGCLSFKNIPYSYIYCFMYIVFMISYFLGFKRDTLAFSFASGNFLFHLLCIKGTIVAIMALGCHTSMYNLISNQIRRSWTTVFLFLTAALCLGVFRKIFTEEKVNLLIKDFSQVRLITMVQGVLNIILIFATSVYSYNIDTVWMTIYHLLLSVMMVVGFYILFNNCVGTCLQKEFKQKEDNLKYQIQSQLEQYEIQSRYIKDLRRLKHDYKNQIHGLRYIFEAGDYEKAMNYIKELDGEVTAPDLMYTQFSNHNLVDAILQDVNAKTKEMKIQFVANIQIENLPFTDLELCTIFSNLMNNALEACIKMEDGQRFIHIKGQRVNSHLVIKTVNSFNGELKYRNGKLETLKKSKDQHGLGIDRIKKIVEAHHGELEIRPNIDNKEFEVFIILSIESV